MIFQSFYVDENWVIHATANGHADEVIKVFREACVIIFTGQGAWRFTDIHGRCSPEMQLDSDMEWSLRAERKVDHLLRKEE